MGKPAKSGSRLPLVSGVEARPQSRPLKTGANFTLVYGPPRIHYLGWDRADYAPGDPCRLTLAGIRLGKEPVSITIEAEQSGCWVEAAKVEAKVEAGQSKAVAEWTFPLLPDAACEQTPAARAAARRSGLVECHFTDGADLAEARTAWVEAQCEGLEGKAVELVLEREEGGKWTPAGSAVATVKAGHVHAGIPLQQG
jgi:hypothetical protein